MKPLHQLTDQSLHVFHRSFLGVAGCAGIGIGGLCQELQILFLHSFQLGGDAHIDAQLADSVHSGLAVSSLVHTGGIYAHSLSNCLFRFNGSMTYVFANQSLP